MEDMVAIDAGNAKVVCMIYINRNSTMQLDDPRRIISDSSRLLYIRVPRHLARVAIG